MKLKYIPILFLLFACRKSFLETDPKGKLVAKTVNDYDLLLNNNTLLNTGGANAQVFLGDEIAAVEPYFATAEPKTQRLFQWEPVVYEPQEDAAETSALLQQLYIYNKIINEVGDASNGTEAKKKSIRAEAMAGRAWVYFQLINYFGKPYNPATAAGDAGFPIIRAADVTATQFNRAPVQEVYDFIVNDLVSAIPDLPVQTTYRIRMAKPAAEALLGKVYMFMGKFDEALPLLNDAIDDLQQASIPVELIDYNAAFAPGGMFLPLDPFFGPTTPVIGDNPETIYARQFSNFWITSSETVITPATVALYGATDLRLNFYSNMPFPAGPEYPAGLLRRMAPLTNPYGVVLPDLILLRAECRVRTNDLAGAVEDVEELRRNRMPEADAAVPAEASSTQKKLIEYIMDERIREFASLGVRWYDMRRLSVDPLFANTSYTHTVYAEDGTSRTIDMPAERLVLKIPPKIMNENPGMEDNQ
jgi:SusD family.